LAQIIASKTRSYFENLSAVLAGVKEIKEVVARASDRKARSFHKTLLFVDEIHRFNKAQQDALLPHVENGTLTLIGATTENPSFELNSALLSRCRVIRFESLGVLDIMAAMKNALRDPERGLGGFLEVEDAALEWMARQADGDVRRALTALEVISLFQKALEPPTGGEPNVPVNAESRILCLQDVQNSLESAMGRQPIRYDHSGEEHYNVTSALIKSIRDSDPHAAVYYLARMLEGGEDPLFIARRLVILASEDIGNADPRALSVAISVKDAVEFIGMPEGRISLSQAVTYLAMAPKSNAAYEAIEMAQQEVRNSGALAVPLHLRNAVTGLMKAQGYAQNYRYPHSESQSRTGVNHLPQVLAGKKFYQPRESGLEIQIRERLKKWE
jgi:putative ATPase